MYNENYDLKTSVIYSRTNVNTKFIFRTSSY